MTKGAFFFFSSVTAVVLTFFSFSLFPSCALSAHRVEGSRFRYGRDNLLTFFSHTTDDNFLLLLVFFFFVPFFQFFFSYSPQAGNRGIAAAAAAAAVGLKALLLGLAPPQPRRRGAQGRARSRPPRAEGRAGEIERLKQLGVLQQ